MLLALITLSTTAENLQPYKYNGKELYRMYGLDLVWMTIIQKRENYIYTDDKEIENLINNKKPVIM